MNHPLIILGAILVGIVIGWILATEINNLQWKKLSEFQKNTIKAQRDVIDVRKTLVQREEQVITWVRDLKQKEAEIGEEWKKAVAANQDALQTMKDVNAMKDRTKEEWEEAVAASEEANRALEDAVKTREKAFQESREEKQQS